MNPIGIAILIVKTILKLAWLGGTTGGALLAEKRQTSAEQVLQSQSKAAQSGTMDETVTCPECGAVNESTDTICYVCGSDLFTVSMHAVSHGSGVGQAVDSAFNQLLPIIGGLVAIVMTCFICNACGQYD